MLSRSKLTAILLLVAVFAAGAVVGGAASAALADRGDRDRRRERPSYVDRLDREIGLRPGQRDTIQEIVNAYDVAMNEVWREVRPRFEAVRQDVRGRIAAALDSAQTVQYRALIARTDSIRAHRDRERGDSAKR